MRIIPSRGVCGHTDKRAFLVSGRRVARFDSSSSYIGKGGAVDRFSLSLLDSVYKFSAEHRAYVGLLVLMKGDWTNLWCPEVYCSDASEKGWSFVTRAAPVSLVARHGRVLERCCRCLASCRLWSFRAGRGHLAPRNTTRASGGAVCV